MRERGNAVNDLVSDMVEFVRERPDERNEILRGVEELSVYEDAAAFLAREFDADVTVLAAGNASEETGKAKGAVPFRPAIHLE